jgi:hypothetical protein
LKSVIPIFTVSVCLLVASIIPVHAFISVTTTIGDSIYVVYYFQNLDSPVYNGIKANYQYNITSTISTMIVKHLAAQGQDQVYFSLGPETGEFYDSSKSIHVSFYLWGSDVLRSTINRTSMKRIVYLNTDWRKFQLSLTNGFSINFTQLLSEPVIEWQKPNENTFLYEAPELSFKFILPRDTEQVRVQGDTIIFEFQPNFWDVFINSPFPILIAIIIIVIIAAIYRRIR